MGAGMQKAEPQHKQNQPVQWKSGGASLESPQGEQIAQLEAMIESSPQSGRLAELAAMMDNSPQATAQRRMMDTIRNSPRMAEQRKAISAIHNSPHVTAQRQQLGSLIGKTAQREEVEEPLQPKVAQREETPAKPNNTGLPDNLKSGIESLSGISMDNVRVHYNSSQPAQLNALAYAQGTDIHVAPGQEQHLPHEAWHVVQQAQGRVKPTLQMKGGVSVSVNDDTGLEHEADVMGAKAASSSYLTGNAKQLKSGLSSAGNVCQLSYSTLTLTGQANIDAQAEKVYAEKAEDFEYALGMRLSTATVPVAATDEFLRKVKNIVDAWANQTNQQRLAVYGQAFKFETGNKYYGAFEMTGQNVANVFQSLEPFQPGKPMRSKLKVIYNAVRNNNLAKWLKVAADDLLDLERYNANHALGRHSQSAFSSDADVFAGGGINLGAAQHEQVLPGFAQQSGLAAPLLADPALRARVDAASAREKVNVNLGAPGIVASHIGAPDAFSAIARGTPAESGQMDIANRDREYNVNQGADYADQETLAYTDVADLTDEEKELLYTRAGVDNGWHLWTTRFGRLKTATNDHIQWEQGREAISVMINSEVDKQAQAIGARLEAGISGSTAMMLAGAKNIGLSNAGYLQRLRLAMLGWMLSNHDHSFYEIMTAAHMQGVPFDRNPPLKGGMYEANANYAPIVANTFQNLLPENQFPSYFLSVPYKNVLAGSLAPADVEPANFNVANMRLALIAQGFDNGVINGMASRSVIDLEHLTQVVTAATYKDEAAAVTPADLAKAKAANRIQHMHVRDSVPYRNVARNHPAHAERWYGLMLQHRHLSLTSDQELLLASNDAALGNTTADLAARTAGLEQNAAVHVDGIPADLLVGLNQNVIDDLVMLGGMVAGLALTPNTSLYVAPNKPIYDKLLQASAWDRVQRNIGRTDTAWLMLARLFRRHHGDFFYKSIYSSQYENPNGARALQAGVPRNVVQALPPQGQADLVQLINDIHTIAGQPAATQLAALNALGTIPPLSTLKQHITMYVGANFFDVTVSSIAAREGIDLSTDAARTAHAQTGASLSPGTDINSPGPVNPNLTAAVMTEARFWENFNYYFRWFGGVGLHLLTAQEKAAIFVYTGAAGEGAWQNFLATADVSLTVLADGRTARQALIEEMPQIQTAISGLRKLPPQAGPVYNAQYGGVPLNVPLFLQTFRVGSVHNKNNFFSTSTSNNTTFMTDPSYPVAWVVNKVKSGKLISVLSQYADENEVLFPPGASFVVTKVEDKSNPALHPLGYGKVWVTLDEL
jgi:hypothetical protein